MRKIFGRNKRKLIAEKIQISIVEMIKWQSIIKTDYLRIPGL